MTREGREVEKPGLQLSSGHAGDSIAQSPFLRSLWRHSRGYTHPAFHPIWRDPPPPTHTHNACRPVQPQSLGAGHLAGVYLLTYLGAFAGLLLAASYASQVVQWKVSHPAPVRSPFAATTCAVLCFRVSLPGTRRWARARRPQRALPQQSSAARAGRRKRRP